MGYADNDRAMQVIGIDAGGTRTVCQLADAAGHVLAEVRGGGANLQSQGEADVESVLGPLIAELLPQGARPAVICLGIAGADRPRDVTIVDGILGRIGRGARGLVVSDALVALEAGAPRQAGVVMIAGTGSIAYGRDADGRAARAGGWGYVLGDEGSGYWLGRQALRAVVRAADGRGPETKLAARILAHYGATGAQDLIQQIAGGGSKPSAIAELAYAVGSAADDDDPVAHLLVKSAAQELAAAARAVIGRLALKDVPLVLAGGTLLGVQSLQRETLRELARLVPEARPLALDVEPAYGAVRLACDALAGQLVLPTYVE